MGALLALDVGRIIRGSITIGEINEYEKLDRISLFNYISCSGSIHKWSLHNSSISFGFKDTRTESTQDCQKIQGFMHEK